MFVASRVGVSSGSTTHWLVVNDQHTQQGGSKPAAIGTEPSIPGGVWGATLDYIVSAQPAAGARQVRETAPLTIPASSVIVSTDLIHTTIGVARNGASSNGQGSGTEQFCIPTLPCTSTRTYSPRQPPEKWIGFTQE